ncbi:hypothetical protein [Corallococcus sp. 4LFB]|uniref:hypothetical protein n=1 Tax=Corallococcus sp. 4LFB TaxID=3383249 RepID=UPI00397704B0
MLLPDRDQDARLLRGEERLLGELKQAEGDAFSDNRVLGVEPMELARQARIELLLARKPASPRPGIVDALLEMLLE